MDDETTPDTPSVSTVDNDAERLAEIRKDMSVFNSMSGLHEVRGSWPEIAKTLLAALDSRDAALREAGEQIIEISKALGQEKTEVERLRGVNDAHWVMRRTTVKYGETLEAALRGAREEVAEKEESRLRAVRVCKEQIMRATRHQHEAERLRSALERLGGMEAFVLSRAIDPARDEELLARIDFARDAARSQPATPSPVPTQQQDIGSSVMTDLSGRQQPSPEAVSLVLDAARRHVASFEPGTLMGSELYLAAALAELDGIDRWGPWCEPGEAEADPATVIPRQDTADVTDEPKQHSSVRADDHEVGQPSPEAAPWCRDAWFTLTTQGDGEGTSIHHGWDALCAATLAVHYHDPDPDQRDEVYAVLTDWESWRTAPDGHPWLLHLTYEDGDVSIARITAPATVAPDSTPPAVTDETKNLLQEAERLWDELQKNELGGYSGINRPFYITHRLKQIDSAARAEGERAGLERAAQIANQCVMPYRPNTVGERETAVTMLKVIVDAIRALPPATPETDDVR